MSFPIVSSTFVAKAQMIQYSFDKDNTPIAVFHNCMNDPVPRQAVPRAFTVKTAFDEDTYEDQDLWIQALRVVLPGLLAETPRVGDIVHDEACGSYRNQGKLIFDGEEWQELDYGIDEYGALPHYIRYPEFALGSHLHLISHNCISWITIDEQVTREISGLKILFKTGKFSGYWHIVGTLLGKEVDWQLDQLDEDFNETDDSEAKFFLRELRKSVTSHPGKSLAVSFDGEQIVGFESVHVHSSRRTRLSPHSITVRR
jgi:hypothetical protein